jgi:glycosyltransferase involved in cell wall biosynthesis
MQMLRDEGNELKIIHHCPVSDGVTQYIKDYLRNSRDYIKWCDLVWVWFADIHAVPLIIQAHRLKKPVVVFCGDYEVNNAPDIKYGNQRLIFRGAITRWVLRNADEVITPSYVTARVIRSVEPVAVSFWDGEYFEGCKWMKVEPTIRISVIPWCVKKCEFGEEPDPPKENRVSTACGSINAYDRKGLGTFIDATMDQPHRVSILGDRNRVEYIDILKRSKVYCQLSYPGTESFGVSLLEAMYYGCIPVITNDPALQWVAGGTGIVVPYRDVLATRKAIDMAMGMDGTAAMNRAHEFTYEQRLTAVRNLLSKYKTCERFKK